MEKAQHSDQSSFMETVEEIRRAEHESAKIKLQAKESAEHAQRKGREAVLKAQLETEQEITSMKNSMIKKGNAQVESEIETIIEEAKEEAQKIRGAAMEKKQALKAASQQIFSD